jgi:hypothetical protein
MPNHPLLRGTGPWCQVVQLDWPLIRVSALAGGVLH